MCVKSDQLQFNRVYYFYSKKTDLNKWNIPFISKMAANCSTVKKLKKFFVSKGSRILGIVKDKKILPLDRVPSGREKVQWTCAWNEDHVNITNLEGLLREERGNELLCRGCAIAKSKGSEGFPGFKKYVEEQGYAMMGTNKDYKNSKSKIKVECDKKHGVYETTEHNFRLDHKCKKCANEKQRKHTIESIAAEFLEHYFTLLENVYVNNSTPMKYLCRCGREGKITYSNFTKNTDGCKSCTRRFTYEKVKTLLSEECCILMGAIEKEEEIEPEFILNKTRIKYKCSCSSIHISTWRMFKKGARCPDCNILRFEETCMRVYGTTNPSKLESVKEKIRKTTLENHGVEYAMQNKDIAKKCSDTNKKNHGGTHNLNLLENREKAKQVCFEKYDQEYFLHSEEFKKVMTENYGVEHWAQNKELYVNANVYGRKKFVFPSGKIVYVQGFETSALKDLLKIYTEEEICVGADVPSIKYFHEVGRTYHPDIYIPSENLLIEVKSKWTFELHHELNIKKFQASVMAGYKFEMWIYNKKEERLEQRSYVDSEIIFESE